MNIENGRFGLHKLTKGGNLAVCSAYYALYRSTWNTIKEAQMASEIVK